MERWENKVSIMQSKHTMLYYYYEEIYKKLDPMHEIIFYDFYKITNKIIAKNIIMNITSALWYL